TDTGSDVEDADVGAGVAEEGEPGNGGDAEEPEEESQMPDGSATGIEEAQPAASPESVDADTPAEEVKPPQIKATKGAGAAKANGDSPKDFQMTLPTVYLHINGGKAEVKKMNNSEDHSYHCKGTMDIIVPEGFSYVDSDAVLESVEGLSLDIRGRGNTSWWADKKPYKIKLDKKAKILGMGKNKHWALIANAYDPSLMRNRITYWLGKELGMAFTPSGYPVDVFMEGEYYGTYLLCETMRVDDNRVEIDELSLDDNEAPAITGGYFIQFMQDAGTEATFSTEKGMALQNVTPSFEPTDDEDERGTEAQKAYIRGYIQEAEDALHEGETKDKNAPSGYRKLDYRDYFDLDSAALYWLFHEVSMNADAYNTGSTYIYKTRDKDGEPGKIFWGPLWDFDYAWDYSDDPTGFDGYFTTETEWMTALLTDTSKGNMCERIQAKWPAFKEALLRITKKGGLLDQYYNEVKTSQAYDQEKYGWEDDNGNPLVYKAAVESLRQWILKRIDWFDKNISRLRDYSHKVSFKQDVNDQHPVVFCYRSGSSVYCDLPDPEKKGYIFIGWFTEDGKSIDEARVNKDLVFTAKFVDEKKATKADNIYFLRDELYIPLADGYSQNQYTVTPFDAQDQRVRWKSADPSIARVDEDGSVVPLKLGTTKITAILPAGTTKSYTVHVIGKRKDFKSVSVVKSPIYMKVGDYAQVKVKIDAPSAFALVGFSTDDTEIADVDYSTGTLHALSPGRGTVDIAVDYTKKNEWDSKYLECEVIVSDKEGVLSTETKATGILGEARNLEEAAQSLLTEEDQTDLNGGADIFVQLEMALLEEDGVPAKDKEALRAYLEKEGLTAGAYLDLRLFKTVGIGEPEELHEIPVPVQFAVKVPADVQNYDQDVTRTFHLLRVHDGAVSEVGSGTDTTVVGSSDRFSTYLLAYKDGDAGKPVKTGDDSHAGLMLLIAAASLTVLAGMGIARRRRNHQH
ncbi:MAG: CotH kinase family protein, partial [Firmicutes bacterium]|nr:CotH kinase family protein [Bacillota bacterium]